MSGLFNTIALVVALILGNCQGATDTKAGLPMEFIVNDDRFSPSAPARMRRAFDSDDQPAVHFALSREDAKKFGDFSKAHIGEVMEVRVCGIVVSSPVIMEAIYSRNGILAGPEMWQILEEYLDNGCS